MTFKQHTLFDELQILNVFQINYYTFAILTSQFINNQLPTSLKNIFRTNEDVHNLL